MRPLRVDTAPIRETSRYRNQIRLTGRAQRKNQISYSGIARENRDRLRQKSLPIVQKRSIEWANLSLRISPHRHWLHQEPAKYSRQNSLTVQLTYLN